MGPGGRPVCARNGKPNRHAAHDLGAASASLSYEAAAEGISANAVLDRIVDLVAVA